MIAIRASLSAAALLLGSAAFPLSPAQANWTGGHGGHGSSTSSSSTSSSGGHSSTGGWNSTSTSSGGTSGGSSGGTPVPEPADFALFGLGVAGLLIGRHGFARRKAATAAKTTPDA